jgi:hypothetical protein
MVKRLEKGNGLSGIAIRRLYELRCDYPDEPALSAVVEAVH